MIFCWNHNTDIKFIQPTKTFCLININSFVIALYYYFQPNCTPLYTVVGRENNKKRIIHQKRLIKIPRQKLVRLIFLFL